MRVSNKMIYNNSYINMMHSEEVINQKNKEISSGKRIGIPSDDPFGTSRAMIYRTNLTEITQYTDNSNRANSWLDLTDNSLQTVSSYLQRVRELVTYGANSTNPNESREAMAAEIDQIRDSIVQIADTTIDNRYIFAGEKVLEKPYEFRNSVSSNSIDLAITPITLSPGPIPPQNNQFNISIDGNPPVLITLTPGTYNNAPGWTIDDLANDIQTQINASVPATVPVHVKVTSDNKIVFYAGTKPPNGSHSLVLREGNGALAAMNFLDRATTKELIGEKLTTPVEIVAKYPVANQVVFAGGNTITLNPADAAPAGYYDNWTLMTDNGVNVTTQPVTASIPAGTVTFGTALPASPNLKYYLTPPLTGLATAGSPTTITLPLANSSTVDNFYAGMPITITDGTGKGQTRNITSYSAATGVVTVDQPFTTTPDVTSRYSIDASSYINANNKFKITIGNQMTQEINLDGGSYSPAALAQMLQTKIQERGGQYANIFVSVTPDNELRITPRDLVLNNPLPVKLESGSTADGLWLLGFKNGAVSDEPLPNYEGNKGTMNYEINVGIKISVNSVGDNIFDPIFRHLAKISMDLRAGNTTALSGDDLRYVKQDAQNILLTLAEVGAKTNRIDKGIERLKVFDENFNKLLSDVEDTNISKAVIELRMQATAYQAALQTAAQVLPMTLLNYLR